MENNTLSKYTVSFGLSLALCSVLNALLVIAKEKSPAVQAAMQKVSGSHWITHAAIVLTFFVLFGWLFANSKIYHTMPVNRLIKIIVGGIFASGLVIIGFYLIAD
jgi:hypothetical protein